MRKIQESDLKGKKVLLRVDYNVPIKKGQVQNDERILASLETIRYLLEQDTAIVICSHLGRPEGRPNVLYTLEPVAKELKKLINKSVQFSAEITGSERDKKVENLKAGELLLLENLRFDPGEESADFSFAEGLAKGCDLYVNDAFSASHRDHASITKVVKFLPSFAGLSLQEEVKNLSKILTDPKRPFILVMGGAKIKDKVALIENMVNKIDSLILGGAIANTFLLAKGYHLGKSVVEPESVDTAKKIMVKARDYGVEIYLPEDCLVAGAVEAENGQEKTVNMVSEDELVLDVGASSLNRYIENFKFAETIFWNGPMGYAENPAFAKGTETIARGIANSNAFSIIGGGDTISAVDADISKNFSYVSMAGGASLEFLSGQKLPGIEALE